MCGVDAIFDAAPSLKYAEGVDLHSPVGTATVYHSEAFMLNFAGMTSLNLWLGHDALRQFNWTFLLQESSRGQARK
ncbi:hypothetical protein AAVH_27626 [Aphelenchoides avenae]|nr:hypothetical protein AAVH_27626 [Aphelenchus avenae]